MRHNIKKTADCTTRPAALNDLTLIVERVKAGFVRLAVCVSIAIGA